MVVKKPRRKNTTTGKKSSSSEKLNADIDFDLDSLSTNNYESIFFAEEFKSPRSTEEADTRRFEKFKIKALAIAYKSIVATIAVTASLTLILTLAVQSVFNLGFNNSGTVQNASQVVLTEPELREIVSQLGQIIYWAGPMANAKYTLNVNDTAAFVRYLPEGEGVEDTGMNYLVIATYEVNGAFEAVRTAGNEQDGISISNSDGAAVYYNKSNPNNVYIAYPNTNFQIEIFDPSVDRALQIATSPGLIQPIR